MGGGRKQAQPAGGCRLDGGVRPHKRPSSRSKRSLDRSRTHRTARCVGSQTIHIARLQNARDRRFRAARSKTPRIWRSPPENLDRSREPATATTALDEHSSDLSGLRVDWPKSAARDRRAVHEANEIDTPVWRWCVGWPLPVGLVKLGIQLTGFDRCLTQQRECRPPCGSTCSTTSSDGTRGPDVRHRRQLEAGGRNLPARWKGWALFARSWIELFTVAEHFDELSDLPCTSFTLLRILNSE